MQAFFFLQRLNVKTMFTLLQILQPELESSAPSDPNQGECDAWSSDYISAVTRRILPGLRHCSAWLMSNTPLLVAHVGDTPLNVQVKELWKTYANTLTLVAATFSVSDLPVIEYLLEEDEDTIGFKPFQNDRTRRIYYDSMSGNRKATFHDKGIERHHPNLEMLGRLRDLLVDGMELALDDVSMDQ